MYHQLWKQIERGRGWLNHQKVSDQILNVFIHIKCTVAGNPWATLLTLIYKKQPEQTLLT